MLAYKVTLRGKRICLAHAKQRRSFLSSIVCAGESSSTLLLLEESCNGEKTQAMMALDVRCFPDGEAGNPNGGDMRGRRSKKAGVWTWTSASRSA